MSVIKVDVTALADMGKQFTRIKDDFDHIADVTKDADQYVGNADIAKALHRFTDNWSDKRQQISALLGTTATSVTKAAQAYHQSDQDAATQTGGDHQQNTNTPQHSGDQSGDSHPAGCTCGCGGDTVTGDRSPDTTGTDGSAPADRTSTVDASTYPADGYTGVSDTASTSGTAGITDTAGTSDTSGTGYTGSGDTGGGYTGDSGGPGGIGGTSAGSDAQDAPPISGQGSVSDSGDIGMSAQASGGGDTGGAHSDSGRGPGAAGMAETAAPIGLLGAAGAAAWAAQKRRDSEQNPDDEFDE